jgi:hypothetical protein
MIAEPAALLREHDRERMVAELLDVPQPPGTRSGFGERRPERAGQQAEYRVPDEAVGGHGANDNEGRGRKL